MKQGSNIRLLFFCLKEVEVSFAVWVFLWHLITYEMLNFTNSDYGNCGFLFSFLSFFKPVVTSVQTAIPVYLKLKRTISSKQLFGHFDLCGLNSHSSWIKWKNPTLLQWIILGSFCPTPFWSWQETNSPANGISSCVFPSPTDKAVAVGGKLCKNKLKKPTKLNQQPFQLCCASFRQTLAPVQVLLRIWEVLCCARGSEGKAES